VCSCKTCHNEIPLKVLNRIDSYTYLCLAMKKVGFGYCLPAKF